MYITVTVGLPVHKPQLRNQHCSCGAHAYDFWCDFLRINQCLGEQWEEGEEGQQPPAGEPGESGHPSCRVTLGINSIQAFLPSTRTTSTISTASGRRRGLGAPPVPCVMAALIRPWDISPMYCRRGPGRWRARRGPPSAPSTATRARRCR